ncbi:MAG: hypothetical protein WKF52_03745 [Sphingomicrobium sp.]
MTRFMLLTGAAALAIASAATAAPQGNNDRSAKAERGDRQSARTKATAKRGEARTRATAKRSEARVARASKDRRAETRVTKAAPRRDNRQAVQVARDDRRDDRQAVRVVRDDRRDNRQAVQVARDDRRDNRRVVRVVRDDRMGRVENRREVRDDRRFATAERRFDRQTTRNFQRAALGYGTGACPPGLAKKLVACMPPGQARKFVGQSFNTVNRVSNLRELPVRLRTVYRDNDDYYYRYGNGYMYQVDRQSSLISSLLPLFGLGVPIGQSFPSAYSNYQVPSAYQPFYQDTSDHYYRYGDGYVYQVGRNNGLVTDYMPLLASGNGYGQMMPASYSAYNLPSQYRSFYQDNDDHYYRYAPGSIYRVDAGSGLIDSVAALLMTGGMTVGQQMPMGYQTYNVPMQYRSQYYDTPDNMYRYSNGNIYQVDPTTRLVTALISALT